jgi:hypothetical protein
MDSKGVYRAGKHYKEVPSLFEKTRPHIEVDLPRYSLDEVANENMFNGCAASSKRPPRAPFVPLLP